MMAKSRKSAKAQVKGLNREDILSAALELADQQGIAALSMRKLAQALGVEAMSLYNHVKNKEDVLDGMVEKVAEQIELPDRNGNWKSAMRRQAISAHDVLMTHPWAAMLFVSRINVGAASLRRFDAILGCLHAAGFSYPLADQACNAIDNHVYGFTLQALNFPFEESEYSEVAEQYLPMIPEDQYPALNALSKQVIDGSHDGVQEFCFGLDLILNGLDELLSGGKGT